MDRVNVLNHRFGVFNYIIASLGKDNRFCVYMVGIFSS